MNHARFILLLQDLYQGMYFCPIVLNIQFLSVRKMKQRGILDFTVAKSQLSNLLPERRVSRLSFGPRK